VRIFTDLSSHDSSAPGGHTGGRIVRTDSTPALGESTVINGKFVFPVPEGAALTVDTDSFYFPQEDVDSIPSRTAAEFLIRYPMYDHITYNFYLDNEDVLSFETAVPPHPLPNTGNTTPAMASTASGGGLAPRCQLGNPAGSGMCPQSLGMLPLNSLGGGNHYYGSVATTMIDLWYFNPCYISVPGAVNVGDTLLIDGIPLIGVAGVRASGSDNYSVDAPPNAVAADLVAAINDAANSFATRVLATIDPTDNTKVQLRPVPPTNTAVTVTQSVGSSFTIVESHPGTDEVMMWWEVNRMSTSEDQGPDASGHSGPNTPAYKSLLQIAEEDPELLVYASVNDGVSWYRVPYLEPIDLINAGTQLRVAFINLGSTKLYLSGFCVLFPDLLAPL
jgi:hypothetical protein